MDLGSRSMQVAGPPGRDGTPDLLESGTTTGEILAVVAWLQQRQVESVALESTGVYWIPVLEILEDAGLEVVLVDSRPLSRVPGRKTDMLDCQWIQRLHSCGLLRGCYRPAAAVTELRTLARQKAVLVTEQSDWLRRMQKVLDELNVRVHHAVSDAQGNTGMAILRAIVAGEREARKLAALRDPRCRHSAEQITEFLTGNWRSDHLFNLAPALRMYDLLAERWAAYEAEIRRRRQGLTPQDRNDQPAPPLANKERMKALKRRQQLGKRDERQFVKHLQLAPRQNITGGKPTGKRQGRTRTTRTGQALRTAATAVAHTATARGAYYRRKSKAKGPGVAVFATARQLAINVYRLLRYGQAYFDEGQKAYEERHTALRVRAMQTTAAQLGYELVKNEALSV